MLANLPPGGAVGSGYKQSSPGYNGGGSSSGSGAVAALSTQLDAALGKVNELTGVNQELRTTVRKKCHCVLSMPARGPLTPPPHSHHTSPVVGPPPPKQVESLEKERDFYFGKLRDVEIMLQSYAGPDRETVDALFKILYAADDADFVSVDGGAAQ